MPMLHAYLATALAADRRRQCPCGAVAERQNSLCRKCQARVAWRRKALRKSRHGSRRLATRHARTFVRLLADAMYRTSTRKGGDD
jgi:hypothetical protein